jgi:hypothetical protein
MMDFVFYSDVKKGAQAEAFFAAIRKVGFEVAYFGDKTGPRGGEYFALCYDNSLLKLKQLEYVDNVSNANSPYRYVPGSFLIEHRKTEQRFLLVSVHLYPNDARWAERKSEVAALATWLKTQVDDQRCVCLCCLCLCYV